MAQSATVLVVDNDSLHLHLYCLIIEKAGYRALPVLVTRDGYRLPPVQVVDAVLLDYRLTDKVTAVEVAQAIRARFPDAPILLLSDMFGLPPDMEPHVQEFVRKGEPEKLVARLRSVLSSPVAPHAEREQPS